MPGLEVETLLTDKLWRDSSIIGIPITDVRTTVCQNKCSGHGTCNSETRACMCQTFWMPSIYYFWGFSEANCGMYKYFMASCAITSNEPIEYLTKNIYYLNNPFWQIGQLYML